MVYLEGLHVYYFLYQRTPRLILNLPRPVISIGKPILGDTEIRSEAAIHKAKLSKSPGVAARAPVPRRRDPRAAPSAQSVTVVPKRLMAFARPWEPLTYS